MKIGLYGFDLKEVEKIKKIMPFDGELLYFNATNVNELVSNNLSLLFVNSCNIGESELIYFNKMVISGDAEVFFWGAKHERIQNQNFFSLEKNEQTGDDLSDYLKAFLQIRHQQNKFEMDNSFREAIAEDIFNILEMLVDFIGQKDSYTKQHCERVARYAFLLSKKMGLTNIECEKIFRAGLIHDVGKIGISDYIMTKKGFLTAQEYNEVQKHSQIASDLVSKRFFNKLRPLILQHHERWDGGGYPQKLAGNEIMLEARILSVVDAFDAMTSKRSYNEPMSINETLAEIEYCSGTQFDPLIAEQFIDLIKEFHHANGNPQMQKKHRL